MSGIAVGVFSVIGVMTIITALKDNIDEQLNVLGASSFQINKYGAIQHGGPHNPYANRRDIDLPQAQRFKDLLADSGASVSIQIGRYGRQAVYLDRKTNPNNRLVGSDENYLASRNFAVGSGRNLTAEDVSYGRPLCVIGADTAKRLFAGENPVDHQIRVDGQSYTVVGVLEAKGPMFGESQDNIIITPITRFLAIYGRANRSIGINVQARSAAEVGPTMDRAIGAMRVVRGLDPEDSNDFEVFTNDTLLEAFNGIANVFAGGAFAISMIALVAAGVGIMNIMLVSVTERTKEIGIRKSLGAQRRAILRQFLIEAVVIAQFGGLMGIVVGLGGGTAIAVLAFDVSPVFPITWVVVGFAFCAAIGIVFGYYPAWKAARLDPIEALRFE